MLKIQTKQNSQFFHSLKDYITVVEFIAFVTKTIGKYLSLPIIILSCSNEPFRTKNRTRGKHTPVDQWVHKTSRVLKLFLTSSLIWSTCFFCCGVFIRKVSFILLLLLHLFGGYKNPPVCRFLMEFPKNSPMSGTKWFRCLNF